MKRVAYRKDEPSDTCQQEALDQWVMLVPNSADRFAKALQSSLSQGC
jgi:hypothetical protein